MCLIFKELNKFERNKKKHTNDSDADYAQWNKHDKKVQNLYLLISKTG